ncbi:hypothetical protein T492DRAFT_890943 [Pavlovales sp. CCMP2436]|nr:hypothetical protein T492DRAFT_890943 [Pavlovales sp. CCMP2436]
MHLRRRLPEPPTAETSLHAEDSPILDGTRVFTAPKARLDKLAKKKAELEGHNKLNKSSPDQITPKVISIFNYKGGVGKTTVAINVAGMLAGLDKRVLVIDCDPQHNLTSFFMPPTDGNGPNAKDDPWKQAVGMVDPQDIGMKDPNAPDHYFQPFPTSLPVSTYLPSVEDRLLIIPGSSRMYDFDAKLNEKKNDLKYQTALSTFVRQAAYLTNADYASSGPPHHVLDVHTHIAHLLISQTIPTRQDAHQEPMLTHLDTRLAH